METRDIANKIHNHLHRQPGDVDAAELARLLHTDEARARRALAELVTTYPASFVPVAVRRAPVEPFALCVEIVSYTPPENP